MHGQFGISEYQQNFSPLIKNYNTVFKLFRNKSGALEILQVYMHLLYMRTSHFSCDRWANVNKFINYLS